MRVFDFSAVWSRRALPVTGVLIGVLLGVVHPTAVLAQWPAELDVRVRDAVSGSAVHAARVWVLGTSHEGRTTTQGGAILEGLRGGPGELSVEAFGYAALRLGFTAAHGRRTVVQVLLEPDALVLSGIEAAADRPSASRSGALRLSTDALRTSTAATVGEALATLPGVLVRRDAAGGSETVSVRGSPADAVLVLVDGIPINDALSGEADLSRIPLAAVEEIVLHRGAASALFGPRARAGAVEITTSSRRSDLRFDLGAGSLGRRTLGVLRSHARAGLDLSGGAQLERVGGGFGFRLPSEVGGGLGRRTNADLLRANIWAGADAVRDDLRASLRASADRTERGLPGVGYGPTVHARQSEGGAQMALAVSADRGHGFWEAALRGSFRENRFHDPAPPFGLPYDESARVVDFGGGLRGSRDGRTLGTVDAGIDLGAVGVESSSLGEGAPERAVQGGTHVGFVRTLFEERLRIASRLRMDRDGWTSRWYRSHALTATVHAGALQLDLSHRSSFSPPTLSDQFFSEGYAVRPNPDLRGERIPGEVELSGRYGSSRIGVGGSVFQGDVTDLIVWQPDFRFVWSPSNTDVRRAGGEAWIELRGRTFPWRAQGSFTHTRLRYDRAGPGDTVQVAYRPRNSGNVTAAWSGTHWGLTLNGHYVGRRFPVPAPINALDGFWAWDARIRRLMSVGSWRVESRLGVRRIFDQRATLVFGFPDPGRTLSLELSITPRRRAAPLPIEPSEHNGAADAADAFHSPGPMPWPSP